MREFTSGASRDSAEGKIDFEGHLCPLVIERYGQYMHKHCTRADGKMRESDDWTQGIPVPVYMKSLFRHFMDLWRIHRGYGKEGVTTEEACCAIMFNTMGILHEALKKGVTDAET